jgi:hypothetical protein
MKKYMYSHYDNNNQIITDFLFPEEHIIQYNMIKNKIYIFEGTPFVPFYGWSFEKLFDIIKTHLSAKNFDFYIK